MATNILGIRNNNTIVSYTAATKRTKQVDLTVSGTNWNPTRAVGVFYADSAGVWRLVFNIEGYLSSDQTTNSIAITGITLKNGTYQSVNTAAQDSGGTYRSVDGLAYSNSDDIYFNTISGTYKFLYISGDVELNAEPTAYTTAANMEGVTAVDVMIPFGQTGMPGEVFGTETAASASGYVYRTTSTTAIGDTATSVCTLTLSQGTYLVMANVQTSQSIGNRYLELYVTLDGTDITGTAGSGSGVHASGEGVRQNLVYPIKVTAASKTIALVGKWAGGSGTGDTGINNLSAVRLAPG